MTTLDLDALERAARAAAPGDATLEDVIRCAHGSVEFKKLNAPAIILALIAAHRAIERGAAQGIVTDEMAERAWEAYQDHPIDLCADSDEETKKCVRAAIEAAFASTPPAPAPDAGEEQSCTCHPDDNPPQPCPRKYALSECRAAAPQPPASDTRPGAASGSMRGPRQAMPTPQPPAVEAEAAPGERLIEAAKEAVAIAKGEAAAIWHVMDNKTVAAYGPWVRFTDHEAALKAKTDEIERLERERLELTLERNSLLKTAASESSRVEAAEASNKALREALEPFAEAADECIDDDDVGANHIWEHPSAMAISIDDLRRARALLSEKDA